MPQPRPSTQNSTQTLIVVVFLEKGEMNQNPFICFLLLHYISLYKKQIANVSADMFEKNYELRNMGQFEMHILRTVLYIRHFSAILGNTAQHKSRSST